MVVQELKLSQVMGYPSLVTHDGSRGVPHSNKTGKADTHSQTQDFLEWSLQTRFIIHPWKVCQAFGRRGSGGGLLVHITKR